MYASLWEEISRQQNSVHPRRRHGASDRVDPASRTRGATPDNVERGRPRRRLDLRSMHPAGARKVVARAWELGHAQDTSVLVARENLVHSARRGSLHDRPVHHEHRPPEELPEDRLRARDSILDCRCFCGFLPEEQLRESTQRTSARSSRFPPCPPCSPWLELLTSLDPAINPRDAKRVRRP